MQQEEEAFDHQDRLQVAGFMEKGDSEIVYTGDDTISNATLCLQVDQEPHGALMTEYSNTYGVMEVYFGWSSKDLLDEFPWLLWTRSPVWPDKTCLDLPRPLVKLQLLARTVHAIDLEGSGVSFPGLLAAALSAGSTAGTVDDLLRCGGITVQTKTLILEGFLDLLKEATRKVKIITPLDLPRSPELQLFNNFVESLSTWALVNSGTWLVATFDDFLQTPRRPYQESSECLSAADVIALWIKLEILPQEMQEIIAAIDKAACPKPRVGTDDKLSPRETCFMKYMRADLAHPWFVKNRQREQSRQGGDKDEESPERSGVRGAAWS